MPIILGLSPTDEFKNPMGLTGMPGLKDVAAKPVEQTPSRTAIDVLIGEAAGEGPSGMTAVAAVIKNRAAAKGVSIDDVIKEPDQFTAFSNPGPDVVKAMRDPAMRAQAQQILEGVLSGKIADPTDGADHYHADYVSPSWAGKMRETKRIGRHLFYRSKDDAKATDQIVVANNLVAKNDLGLLGDDPFKAVLKDDAVPNPEAKGLARLVSPTKESSETAGALSFVHKGQEAIDDTFRAVLEGASADIGKPLVVTSGYRDPSHKVERSKARPGQHSQRTASDISLRGLDDAGRARLVESLIARGAKRFITYTGSPDMLHVDMKDQHGDGRPYFMHDKTARNLNRAPGWMQELAGREFTGAETPTNAKSAEIVVDGSYQPADNMGLLRDNSSFAAARDQAMASVDGGEMERRRQASGALLEKDNSAADSVAARLEAESPGRYKLIDPVDAKTFQADWEAQNRSSGLAGDTSRHLAAGNADLGLVMDEAARMIPGIGPKIADGMAAIDEWFTGKPMKQRLSEYSEKARTSVSPRQQEADEKVAWDSEKNWFGPALYDPRWYVGQAAESVPAMASTMMPGAALARASYLRALAAGQTQRVAAKRAAATATIAGALGEGVLGGAQSSLEVRRRIAELPRATLLQSDAVQALISQGMSEDEAVSAATNDAATQAFIYSGSITGMFGGLGDRVLTKIIAEGVGGSITKRVATAAARSTAAEAAEEAGQNAGQTIATNKAVQSVDPSQDLTEGLGESVVAGAAVGGVMGGTIGATAGAVSKADPDAATDDAETTTPDDELNAPRSDDRDAVPVAEPPLKKGGLAEAVKESQRRVEEAVRKVKAPSEVPDNMPPPGSTVLISEDGVEVMGTIDSWENGEAVILDSQTGEVLQVPATAIKDVMHRPGEPIMSERVDTMPPAEEQKRAVDAFPGLPEPGARVVVDSEGVERFPGKVERYEGDEAVVKKDDGATVQVPVSDLTISGLTKTQVEQQDAKIDPPVERDEPEKTPTLRKVAKRNVDLPDERHARLFDLGVERLTSRRLLGRSALDMDKMMPPEQTRLAKEFGITPEALGQMADDYRYRVERAGKEAKSDLPVKMHPVNEKRLREWQSAAAKLAGAPLFEAAAKNAEKSGQKSAKIDITSSKESGMTGHPAGHKTGQTDPISAAAHGAATSPQNTLPEPTDAQKEAGNYKLGHMKLGGLDISIENPKGSTRKGKSKSGKGWEVLMKSHYGYLKGTVGRDKDHIDVFVRPGVADMDDSASVYVIDQRDPARGKFDEHKVMLGWDTPKAARDAYLENYDKNWKGLGAVTPTTLGEFKEWLRTGDTKAPFGAKWFGTKEKAAEYISKEKLGDRYEVVPNGLKFEVQRKAPAAKPAEQSAAQPPAQRPSSEDKGQTPLEKAQAALDAAPFDDVWPSEEEAMMDALGKLAGFDSKIDKELEDGVRNGFAESTLGEMAGELLAGKTAGGNKYVAQGNKATKSRDASVTFTLMKPDGPKKVTLGGRDLGKLVRKAFKDAAADIKAVDQKKQQGTPAPANKPQTEEVLERRPRYQGEIYPEDGSRHPIVKEINTANRWINALSDADFNALTARWGSPGLLQTIGNAQRPLEQLAEMQAMMGAIRAEIAAQDQGKNAAAQQAADQDRFANNKLFTADKVEAARARLKAKMSQLNSGLDPEVLIDGMTIAGAYIEAGVRDFSQYAKMMADDFGPSIKPYLLSFWEGARNYPGLDTTGMTDTVNSARMHADLNKEIATSEKVAVGNIVPSPEKRAKKKGNPEDMTLTDDWGVDHIDAYTDEGEQIKAAFLKEGRKFLGIVADQLMSKGFTAHSDAKGRPQKHVTVNEGGIAVSGDVGMSLISPNGTNVWATIAETALRGVVPTTQSGSSIMYRVSAKPGDRFASRGGANEWPKTGLTAGEYAAMIERSVTRLETHKENFQKGIIKANANEPSALDRPGAEALEGISAGAIPPTGGRGDARSRAAGSSRPDVSGSEPAGAERVSAGRSVPDGQGELPVPAAGADQPAAAEPVAPDDRGRPERAEVDRDLTTADTHKDIQSAAVPAQNRPVNFALSEDDRIGEGGQKTKFRANVAAIRILRTLADENRPATRDEQTALAKWVGWGGLRQAFYREDGAVTKGWEKEAAELKELLDAEEYRAAESSTRNAHYTATEVVTAMWDAVRRFGFSGGQVLEPSVGAGNFLGLLPADLWPASKVTGVELDRITGGIAKNLYPLANIQAPIGFQDFAVPDNHFDLAIGNPPFGSERLFDKNRKEVSKFSIHNYFFAKSVDGLRPGGVLAMVITNRFLDGNIAAPREYIAKRADLIGAIRLPNSAFAKNAGTEVTTDIVFLKKREPGAASASEAWTKVDEFRGADGKTVPLNRYFVENPQMMLGDFGAYGTMYGPDEPALVARPDQDLPADLAKAIEALPANIMAQPGVDLRTEEPGAPIEARDVHVGSLFLTDTGEIQQRMPDSLGETQTRVVEFASDTAKERVSGMIRVRDAFARLRKAQIDERADDAKIENLRSLLNKVYDGFVKKHGPINHDTNKRLFRDDPTWPQISALEEGYDKGVSAGVAKSTGEKARAPSAKKAKIFERRTQQPYRRPDRAKSAKDALAQTLADLGRVDLAAMSSLYGKDQDEIVAELGTLLYRTPAGAYETADQYLSGNVRAKLAEAERAAETNSVLRRNIDALRAIIPADIDAVDIDVKPGAPWIPPRHVEAFIEHISDGTGKAKAFWSTGTAKWAIDAPQSSPAAQVQWATGRTRVSQVLEAVLNGNAITIYDRDSDGKTHINAPETDAANEKAEKVKAEWRKWLWSDDARRDELARIYNDTFNTDVQRQFDGSHLQLPGKVGDDIISLRPHQKNFVWRVMQSSTTLADHTVGAGKTFALIAAAMELRRTGQAKKPMFIVPNHLVGQWAADFIKLYPGANVLATTKNDFDKENRKRLFARITTGDWDAVIVAHSSFGKIGVSTDYESRFIREQLADIETSERALKAATGEKSRNVAQLAKRRETIQTRLQKLLDSGAKDKGMTFDELGIDAMFVDEAHEFKNLGFVTSMTRVAGLGNPVGSAKASDLYMKIQNVLERTGGRNIVFATGTPLSNTMAEMFTVQRYLDNVALKQLGISHFDAWAKVFGEVVTDWELSPSGQYKLNSRFAKFVNMPELMQRYLSFADVITNDDIKAQLAAIGKTLPLPKVKGGKPTNIVVERTRDQAAFIGEGRQDQHGNLVFPEGTLVWRAENLPKKAEKGADNMLKVMSDARKAALDMRLIDASHPDVPGSKVHIAADNIRRLYDAWNDKKGTQLVFIDLSTPKKAKAKEEARLRELIAKADQGDEAAQETLDKMSPDEFMALDSTFSVYDDLRQKLIDRGIPEGEIAFIHDANTELQKEELFGKVRSGRVRILFGSTPKMGAGTNVQNRLVALHHLDAPWRPSDLEQRDGRGIRQGNELYNEDPEGFEIEILRYATKNTLDARQWQTIEGKAKFIQQMRKGGTKTREIEDIGGEASNAAEMKAAASGNPLILEEMDTRRKLRKLEDQSREHDREQHRIRSGIRGLQSDIERLTSRMPAAEADAAKARKAPERFLGVIDGKEFDKHKEFGEAMVAKMRAMLLNTKDESVDVGRYGDFGLSIETMTRLGQVDIVVNIDGSASYQINIENPNKVDPVGLARRIQNTVSRLADAPEGLRAEIETKAAQIPQLEKQIGAWDGAAEFEQTATRHRELLEQLKPKKKEAPAEQPKDTLADAPLGWGAADTDNGLRFTEADFAEVEEIISRVSGLDKTIWADRLKIRMGDKLWGEEEAFYPAGLYNTMKDIIAISREHAFSSVAYHESFHRIQNLFLTAKERAVLKAEKGRLKRIVASKPGRESQVANMHQVELEAEAFAIYASGLDMKVKPHAAIRAMWDRIIELMRQINNFIAGRGFQTAETIFDRARAGEMTSRKANAAPALAPGMVYSRATARVTEGRAIESVRGKLVDLSPALLKAVPLNYFTELKRPNMAAVDGYLKMKRALDAYRGTKHAESDAIAQEWLKFTRMGFAGKDKAKAQMLADLMHESTLLGIDPSVTSEGERAKPGWEMLRKKYMAMAPAGRQLYGKVRDAYVAQADELDAILLDNVRKTMEIALERAEMRYNKDVERIKKSGLTAAKLKAALDDAAAKYKAEAKRSQWSMKARLTQLRIAFESSRVPAPYFPLGRFGRYFVAVTDVNGETLSFSRHESAADRDRTVKDMKREFPTAAVKAGVLDNSPEMRDAMDPRIIAEIETILGTANVGQDVMDQIWQRYLESMPDLSTRKRFIHRKGVSGYNADALRVFASHFFHAAHQMARLKYGMELQEMVNKAKDQAQEADDQTRAMTLANELASRHDWVMNPKGSRVAQTMTSAAFVWMLAASPASAMVNLSQTVMMGVPILGARYGGLVKASAAILKASNDFVRGRGDISRAVSEEERAAMRRFYDSGLIDRTHSHDMAGVGDTGVDYSPMKSKVMATISWAFHRAEVANREITAMAAYRLARSSGANMTDAIDQAHDLTWKTHFDYSNSSRPALMQNDVAKVALVFRAYQINMLYRLFRDIHQSVKGESRAARKEARYQLAGILGMQAAMAGVAGVAGFNLAMGLASLVFGDDDDPMDFETQFRKSVLDILGPELGGVVMNGAPGHYSGVSLTERIGMPDLWFRSPTRELQGKDEYQYWLSQVLGASFAVGEKVYTGFSIATEGDVARGVEVAAPKAIGDLMKAYRYASEGLTNLKGDEIVPVEDIGAADIIRQAVGFTPQKIAEAWDRKTALENAEQRIKTKRTKLIGKFALAVAMEDADAKAEAIDDIKAFNAVPAHRAVVINKESLKRSIATRARNARKREDGALIENPALSKMLREKLPNRVY